MTGSILVHERLDSREAKPMFCNNHNLEMGGASTQDRDQKGIRILVEDSDKGSPLGSIR
jgi:hypothetical protein